MPPCDVRGCATAGLGDELLDERRLPPGGGQEGPEMASVDAEAGEADARGGDLGLALAVHVLPGLDAREDDAELLELANEVGRRGCPLAELGEVDLVLPAP